MITYIHDAPNIENKELVRTHIETYFDEARKILPELPVDIKIWLDDRHMIRETGEGGMAHASDVMNISFDINFPDKALQLKSLRGRVFHEAYHMVQGFTHLSMELICTSVLDASVYEGCATVFERLYGNVAVPWGDYSEHGTKTLELWLSLLKETTFERYLYEDGLWQKLAFYDEESGERWRVYKVGTWLVDEALKKTGLDILDLRLKSADDILKLTKS